MGDPQQEDPQKASPDEALSAELSEKTEETARRARDEMESLTRDLDERLASVAARHRSAKASYRRANTAPHEDVIQGASSSRGLAIGVAAAVSILGVPFSFFMLGWVFELRGASPMLKVWMLVGGAVIGLAHGVYIALRMQRD